MPQPIVIDLAGIRLSGEFDDSPAGKGLARKLPIKLNLSRWGEEYYGNAEADLGRHGGPAREEMTVGELAFHDGTGWFCIFFGPTPASHGSEPRAALAVQPVGRVTGDWGAVKALKSSVKATISAA